MKSYQHGNITIYHGDCLNVMPTLPPKSAHCCVTSPPYWGLRDYGTATWEGGDAECDHLAPKAGGTGSASKVQLQKKRIGFESGGNYKSICKKCGARRVESQIGLEETLDEFVATMVEVFRGVWRVLRDDGTLWLNLGDSYNAYNGNRGKSHGANKNHLDIMPQLPQGAGLVAANLKPKDLIGIPWRVAFALQADGWYLRSDIIWHKPNPMPESVTDRPTKSHEYLFLLTKSNRYFYDSLAVREGLADCNAQRTTDHYDTTGRGPRDGGDSGLDDLAARMRNGDHTGRNLRDVWTIPTKGYKVAHFATFPPALVEPCIKAGCPEDGTVLDPFMGSGTVAEVARKNGCRCIGIELNEEYIALAGERLRQGILF